METGKREIEEEDSFPLFPVPSFSVVILRPSRLAKKQSDL